MIAGGMEGWRNPARYVAPLAIAAVAAASYGIVHKALMPKHTTASVTTTSHSSTTTSTKTNHRVSSKAKFYVVRPNDTLLKIAKDTGVPITTLERLNPNIRPDSLHPQQRLRLRQ
jgi:LysM repeat protein